MLLEQPVDNIKNCLNNISLSCKIRFFSRTQDSEVPNDFAFMSY